MLRISVLFLLVYNFNLNNTAQVKKSMNCQGALIKSFGYAVVYKMRSNLCLRRATSLGKFKLIYSSFLFSCHSLEQAEKKSTNN